MYETNKHFSTNPYSKAVDCLNKYMAEKGWESLDDIVIDVEDIYDNVIYPEHEFDLVKGVDLGEHDGRKGFGATIIREKTIFIAQSISDKKNPEFAWTLAHEIGHVLLHTEKDFLLPYTGEKMLFNEHYLNELHADCFAEHLVTPHALVNYRFIQHYGARNRFSYGGPGDYLIDQISCNVSSLTDLYQKLANPLTHYFSDVSVEYLANTMQKLRLVEDKTLKPILVEKRENYLIKGSILHNFITSLDRK